MVKQQTILNSFRECPPDLGGNADAESSGARNNCDTVIKIRSRSSAPTSSSFVIEVEHGEGQRVADPERWPRNVGFRMFGESPTEGRIDSIVTRRSEPVLEDQANRMDDQQYQIIIVLAPSDNARLTDDAHETKNDYGPENCSHSSMRHSLTSKPEVTILIGLWNCEGLRKKLLNIPDSILSTYDVFAFVESWELEVVRVPGLYVAHSPAVKSEGPGRPKATDRYPETLYPEKPHPETLSQSGCYCGRVQN